MFKEAEMCGGWFWTSEAGYMVIVCLSNCTILALWECN